MYVTAYVFIKKHAMKFCPMLEKNVRGKVFTRLILNCLGECIM